MCLSVNLFLWPITSPYLLYRDFDDWGLIALTSNQIDINKSFLCFLTCCAFCSVCRELHGHSDQQVQWADPGEGAGALGRGLQRLGDNLPGRSGGGLWSGECVH